MNINLLSKLFISAVITFFPLAGLASNDLIGNIEGEVTVSEGLLNYTLPIALPEGVHGQVPRVSVQYSQRSGAGLVGSGFSLSAGSAITRCNANKKDDGYLAGIALDSLTKFCHDGKKLIAVTGSNGHIGSTYRIQNDDNHVKYTSIGGSNYRPDSWTVNPPDGRTLTFNKQGTQTERYVSWVISKQKDMFGNETNYEYSENTSGLPLISSIAYSDYVVDFIYEDNTAFVEQYQIGQRVELDQRLQKIQVSVVKNGNESFYYEYRFNYEKLADITNATTPLDRLLSVEQCYSGNNCLKPLTFEYQELPDSDYTLGDTKVIVAKEAYDATAPGTNFHKKPSYVSADIDRDGHPDFCLYQLGSGIRCATFDVYNQSDNNTQLDNWTSDLGYGDNDDGRKYANSLTLVDLNNDGYADYCFFDNGGVRCGLNQSGSSFSSPVYWTDSITEKDSPTFQNLNGDQYLDLCGFTGRDSSGNGQYQCLEGNGNTFSSLSPMLSLPASTVDTWQREKLFDKTYKVEYNSPAWMDINGDFAQDLCWFSIGQQGFVCATSHYQNSNSQIQMALSQPQKLFDQTLESLDLSDLRQTYTQEDPAYAYTLAEKREDNVKEFSQDFSMQFRFANLNGDELVDVCLIESKSFNCRVNTGTGFTDKVNWFDFTSVYGELDEAVVLSFLASMQLRDINFDSMADLCLIKDERLQCALNQVSPSKTRFFGDLKTYYQMSFDMGSSINDKTLFANKIRAWLSVGANFHYHVASSGYGSLINTSDIDGDGNDEFCYRSIEGIVCTSNKNYDSPAVLTKITNSYGLSTKIEYGHTLHDNLYLNNTETLPSGYIETPPSFRAVKSIKTDVPVIANNNVDQTHTQNIINYQYQGYWSNPSLALHGFRTVIQTQPETNNKKVITKYIDKYKMGREYTIKHYVDDVLLNVKTNEFQKTPITSANTLNGERYSLRLTKQIEQQYNAEGEYLNTSTTAYSEYDSYGFPKTTELKKVDGYETHTLTTQSTYEHLTGDLWLLGNPTKQTVTHKLNNQDSIDKEVSYEYKNGVLYEKVTGSNTTKPLTTRYEEYDSYGHPKKITVTDGATSRVTQSTFDSRGRALTVIDALNQQQVYKYEHSYCSGATKHIDIAKRESYIEYDLQCRKKREWNNSDSNETTYHYSWFNGSQNKLTGQPGDFINPVKYIVSTENAIGTWQKSYHDALGRVIKTASIGFSVPNARITIEREIIQHHLYDRHNRKVGSTLPLYKTGASESTPSWASVTYDKLGRVDTETSTGPDGQAVIKKHSYTSDDPSEKNFSSVTLNSTYTKATVNNIIGKIKSITENGLTISHTYYSTGDLDTTTHTNRQTKVKYDSRGFKNELQDPDTGTWTYTHNAFGELETQTDARQKTTTYVYDLLGRKDHQINDDGTTTWQYYTDTNNTGYGQLKSESTSDTLKEWQYDTVGRIHTETLTVNNRIFTTTYHYDDYSRVNKIIQPNGLTVLQGYDNTGQLSQVKIPADQIQDVDWDHLSGLHESLLKQIIRIEARIRDYQSLIAYHLQKSIEYEARINFYSEALTNLQGEINSLQELAEKHRKLARDYSKQADLLDAEAKNLKEQFGDKVFKYKGIETNKNSPNYNKYIFEYEKCTRHHAWYNGGTCRKREFKYVYVPVGNINSMADHAIANYDSLISHDETIELFNPDTNGDGDTDIKGVIPHSLYTKAAKAYRKLAENHIDIANEADNKIGFRNYTNYEINYTLNKEIFSSTNNTLIRKDVSSHTEILPTTLSTLSSRVDEGIKYPAESIFPLADGTTITSKFPCYKSHCLVGGQKNPFEFYDDSNGVLTDWMSNSDIFRDQRVQGVHSWSIRFHHNGEAELHLKLIILAYGQLTVATMNPIRSKVVSGSVKDKMVFKYQNSNLSYSEKGPFYTYYLNNGKKIIINIKKHKSIDPRREYCQNYQGSCFKDLAKYNTRTVNNNNQTYTKTYINNISVYEKFVYTPTLDQSDVIITTILKPIEYVQHPETGYYIQQIITDESKFLTLEDLSPDDLATFNSLYKYEDGIYLHKLSDKDIIPSCHGIPQAVALGGKTYRIEVEREENWKSKLLTRQKAINHYIDLHARYDKLWEKAKWAASELTREYTPLIQNYDNLLLAMEAYGYVYDKIDGSLAGSDLASYASHQASLVEQDKKLTLWAATGRNPLGQVSTEIFGNGLFTQKTYDDRSGMFTGIKTQTFADTGQVFRDIEYTFNHHGLLDSKTDAINGIHETFSYDDQKRLDTWGFIQNHSEQGNHIINHTYDFDDFGNLAEKSDTGALTYNNNGCLTHHTDKSGTTHTYHYDNNGNVKNDGVRAYTWAANNKINTIEQGNLKLQFKYNASQQRAVQEKTLNGATETRYYVNASYEYVVKSDGEEIAQHTFFNGYEAVATLQQTINISDNNDLGIDNLSTSDIVQEDILADQVVYIHRDLLGSGELITNSSMEVIARRYYTPYGREIQEFLGVDVLVADTHQSDYGEDYLDQLYANSEIEDGADLFALSGLKGDIPLEDLRGFTSHEMLDDVELIHMNARLYNPEIGRFLSPDSMVPDATNPLDYNRYLYVRGNPSASTDPSGNFIDPVTGALIVAYIASNLSDNRNVQFAGNVALMFATQGVAAELGFAKLGAAVFSAGTSSFISTYVATGDIGQGVQAGAISAVAAGVANWGAHSTLGKSIFDNSYKLFAYQATSQGIITSLRNGSGWGGFRQGAVSALIAKSGGAFAETIGSTNDFINASIIGITSGYVSEYTGGDFKQGAMTAAIVYLFNDQGDNAQTGSGKWEVRFGADGSSSHSVYGQEVTVVDENGNVLGTFEGSSTANPFKPKNPSVTGTDAYPQVKGGSYDLTHGTHKGAAALSVNGDGFVPTTAPNPNFPSQGSTANLIRVHSGYSNTWKGSAGCMTINPAQWDSFMKTVPSSGSGFLIVP